MLHSAPTLNCYEVRTSIDDLVIYKAFHHPTRAASDPWTKNLRWVKVSQQSLPRYTEESAMDSEDAGRQGTLVPLENVCGYSTVFQHGASPSFILKESSSAPRVISLSSKAVTGLTRFHTSGCQRGFAYIDADVRLSPPLHSSRKLNLSRTPSAYHNYRPRLTSVI